MAALAGSDDYEYICARCWHGTPGEDWFRRAFPVLGRHSERRLLRRYLCPECAAGFDDDSARVAFLVGTLPSNFTRLPLPREE